MGDLPRTQVDGTLRAFGGFPYSGVIERLRRRRITVAATAAALSVLVALVSLSVASTGVVASGVAAEDPGGVVVAVDPSGFGWRDGIRPGQRVLGMTAADDPDGWSLRTISSDGVVRTASATGHQASLEGSLGIAAAALIAALVAVLLRSSTAGFSCLSTMVAFSLASTPLQTAGNAVLAPLVVGIASGLPVLWLTTRVADRKIALFAGTLAAAVIGGWVLIRLAGQPAPAQLDAVRHGIASAGLVVASAAMARHAAPRRWLRTARPTAADLVFASSLAAAAIVLVAEDYLPPLVVALTVFAAIIIYPSWRGAVGRLIDRIWLRDIRDLASIDAIEAERTRMAADLHDAPIQELAGVIAGLEGVPESEQARETLRDVTEHLRDVVTQLRPPMLDDLGLVPALESLASSNPAGHGTTVAVIDRTRRDARPPRDVETAAYRIVEEAMRNAAAHSAATRIAVIGVVEADRLELDVCDDGVGMQAPPKVGHHGLGLMRSRAEAVGASFWITAEDGLTVHLRWTK